MSNVLRRLTTGLALALTILAVAPDQASAQTPARTAQDLFPTQVGNEWELQVSGRSGAKERIRVEGLSGSWARITGLFGSRSILSSRSTARVLSFDALTGRSGIAFDVGIARGATYRMDLGGAASQSGAVWELVHDDANVTTFAGVFNHCVVLRALRPAPVTEGLDLVAFAPGVGPVQVVRMTSAGPEVCVLSRARVNGREIARSASPGYFQGSLLAVEPALYDYFGVEKRTLAARTDTALIAALTADPNDEALRRIATARMMIWSQLSYRLDPQSGELTGGDWRTGRVRDPKTGRTYELVHWADIDDNSWSFYFFRGRMVASYYEN